MANAGKSSKNQQLARQWSRMWPKDRAMSKAIMQSKSGEHGDIVAMVLKAFVAGDRAKGVRV